MGPDPAPSTHDPFGPSPACFRDTLGFITGAAAALEAIANRLAPKARAILDLRHLTLELQHISRTRDPTLAQSDLAQLNLEFEKDDVRLRFYELDQLLSDKLAGARHALGLAAQPFKDRAPSLGDVQFDPEHALAIRLRLRRMGSDVAEIRPQLLSVFTGKQGLSRDRKSVV